MEPIYIFLAGFALMLASLSGVVLLWRGAGRLLKKNLRYLITFAAGVFVVVSYDLFFEAVETNAHISTVIIAALFGAFLLELITQLNPKTHHHHGTDHDHNHDVTDARRLLLGDSVHNIADGIVLVPAFLIDIHLGIATAIGIFLHEVVQEVSEFFVLKEAGYSTTKALFYNFVTSSTVLVGIVIGLFTSQASVLTPLLISFAGGAFLYVVLRDLLPSTVRAMRRHKNPQTHLFAGMLGIGAMLVINSLIPEHSHAVSSMSEILNVLSINE